MNELILIVDDEHTVRDLLVTQLEYHGYSAHPTEDDNLVLELAHSGEPPALVLLDIEMPGRPSGLELLRRIKKIEGDIQVVMISGLRDFDTVRECLRHGAYDYMTKPFDLEDLRNTVERALERRRLIRQNREYRQDLEKRVDQKTEEIRKTRDLALLTLAKLAESRDYETGLHLERMAEYSRILAQSLCDGPYEKVDKDFVSSVHKSSPLHDIGKVGIPDAILRKAGSLTPEEMSVMRRHTMIGGDTLRSVLEQFSGTSFLGMATEICYYHHERWDGRGYPYGLEGPKIPLPARIVALADAYDAITSRRPYKEAEAHEEAVRRIQIDSGKHFDPHVVDAFLRCQQEFDSVRRKLQAEAQDTSVKISSTPPTVGSMTSGTELPLRTEHG